MGRQHGNPFSRHCSRVVGFFICRGQRHGRYQQREYCAEKAEEKVAVRSEDVVKPVSEAGQKGRGSIHFISKVSTILSLVGKKQILLHSMIGTEQSVFLLLMHITLRKTRNRGAKTSRLGSIRSIHYNSPSTFLSIHLP